MFYTTGFDDKIIEKIYRISDILQRLYSVNFTKNHLSLYGGTCLNFLHFKKIPRLSLDIDLNYRDLGTGDWGDERDKIDEIIKKILKDLKYENDKINIQPRYPLTRFMINYKTKNDENDSIKIEIGYIRRIPILKDDKFITFIHPESDDKFEIKSPRSEELFGNKFCTLLYRYKDADNISSRDLFDVYTISSINFDNTLFKSSAIIDSLTRPEPRLYKHDPAKVIESVNIDDQLKNLVRNRCVPDELKEKSITFINGVLKNVKEKYSKNIDEFFDNLEFNSKKFDFYKHLNTKIHEHPGILWNLKQLK